MLPHAWALSKFVHCSHNKSVVLPYKELLFKLAVPHDSSVVYIITGVVITVIEAVYM